MSGPRGAEASFVEAGGAAPSLNATANDENVADIGLLCRVCGDKNDNLIPIFQGEGLINNLAEKIQSYLPIKVEMNDALPTQMCHQCASRIISWHTFYQSCAETNVNLNNKLQRYQSNKLNYQINNADESQNDKSRFSHYRLSFHTFDQIENVKCERVDFEDSTTSNKKDSMNNKIEDPLQSNSNLFETFVKLLNNTLKEINSQFENINNQLVVNDVEKRTTLDDLQKAFKNIEVILNKDYLLDSDENEDFGEQVVVDVEPDVKEVTNKDELKSVDKRDVVESNGLYGCTICKKPLKSFYSYNKHMRIHSGEKPCVCHLCGKQFRLNNGLQRHLRETHQKIKNHSCETCGRKFLNKQNLTQHKRIHTGERPYVCSVCGKGFKQSGSLHIHNKSHTDLFPFECMTCDAKFRSNPCLLRHISKHTGEKPHVCQVCGHAFRLVHDLNLHKLVHSDEKPYICNDCGLSFRQKRYLKRHKLKNHMTLQE